MRNFNTNCTNGNCRRKKANTLRNVSLIVMLLLIFSCFFALSACKDPDNYEIQEGFVTVSKPAPKDGSLPTDHTALENIAYLNNTFSKQKNYYMETTGNTSGGAIKQEIVSFRQLYDGVLIVVDTTSSSLIKKAREFCYVGNEVMWRSAKGRKFDGLNTAWEDKLEGHMTIEDYVESNGLPATEFTAYVINEDTLLDASAVTVNADGTYSQTYHLSTTEKTGAAAYYAKKMVFTGGLDETPVFEYISITYTFDKNWVVLSSRANEAYKAKMGITVNLKSDIFTTYEYDTQRAYNSHYQDFFKQFEGEVGGFVPAEKQPTAVGCLGEAFGAMLNGPATLSAQIEINGKLVDGVVYLDVAPMMSGGTIADIVLRADFGNLKLWVEEGKAYLNYDDLKLCMSVQDLLLALQDSSNQKSGSNSALDMDSLLGALGDGEFIYVSKQSATLSSILPLLGLQISVEFAFNLNENNEATLDYLSAQVCVGSIEASATIRPSNATVAELSQEEKQSYHDVTPAIGKLLDIVQNKGVAIQGDLSFETEQRTISLSDAKINLGWANGLKLEMRGQMKIVGVTATVGVQLTPTEVKVAVGNLGVHVNFADFATIEEAIVNLYQRVRDIVGKTLVGNNPLPQIDGLDQLLELLKSSISFTQQLADNGSIWDILSQLKLSNVDNGVSIAFGDILAQVTYQQGKIYLSATGNVAKGVLCCEFCVDLLQEEIQMPDASYLSAQDICQLIDYLTATVNTFAQSQVTLNANFVIDGDDLSKAKNIDATLQMHCGDDVALQLDMEGKKVTLSSNLYMHLHLAITNATYVEGKDLYLDVWLYQSQGQEGLQSTVQISKFDPSHPKYAPLAISMTTSQLASVVTSALAAVGVDNQMVNQWIVSKYLSIQTAEQLNAIGNALLGEISLGSSFEGLQGSIFDKEISLDELVEKVLKRDENGNYDGGLDIVVDGALLGDGLGDIKVSLQKITEQGVSLLQGFGVGKITSQQGEQILANLTISYQPIQTQPMVAPNAKHYQIDGAKQLIETLANSLTCANNGATDGNYSLCDYFYMEGEINASLSLAGFINAKVNVKVDLSARVDEQGQIQLNVRLQYSRIKMLYEIIKGDTILDITVKEGVMYMRRTQTTDINGKTLATPLVEMRSVAIAEFASSNAILMDNLAYMFNLGDKIVEIMGGIVGDDTEEAPSEETTEVIVDFGETAGNLVSNYSFVGEQGNSWDITLNGEGLSGGMLDDVHLILQSNSIALLHSLTMQTAVNMSGMAISVDATFVYQNPQMVMVGGIADTTVDVYALFE